MIIQYIIDKIRSLKASAVGGKKTQAERVNYFISNGEWTTLREISAATGAPEASVSAHLRDLRKPKFGGHTIEKRYTGKGVYQYRFIYNSNTQETLGF